MLWLLPFSSHLIMSSFWGIIDVMCFLLSVAPWFSPVCIFWGHFNSSVGSLKSSWHKEKSQIGQKLWSQIVHIPSWDSFPHMPNYQDFQIISGQIKGILLQSLYPFLTLGRNEFTIIDTEQGKLGYCITGYLQCVPLFALLSAVPVLFWLCTSCYVLLHQGQHWV